MVSFPLARYGVDMTTRHTPGPWTVGQVGQVMAGGHVLADCYSCDDEQADVDARLMAAAPDLLEALKDIADDYTDRFDLESPSTNPGIKHRVRLARAAIAKAQGETP